MYTTGSALLEAMQEAGIEYIFANFGSDHSSLIEAIAAAKAAQQPIPRIITTPNEMVALAAAHGYAQVTGRAQAVVVHVDCGTQALGGAIHNAAKGRIPVFIFAGTSPFTQEGEYKGSRNEFIQWVQDVFDQRGIMRGYVRYDNEIRTGANVKQLVRRALQFAHSEPRGPVYLVGGREVMEAEVTPVTTDAARWPPIAPAALADESIDVLVDALVNARRPLIVTSYLGREPAAVEQLVRLSHRLGIGVTESVPGYVNFPAGDSLYLGNQWNQPYQNAALAEADVILVIDSDVPWISAHNKPRADAKIFHIDTDPLKQQMPLWYIGAQQVLRAHPTTALKQINKRLDSIALDAAGIRERQTHYEAMHNKRTTELVARERAGDTLTAEYLTACIRRAIGEDAIVVNEGVTNYHVITDHTRRVKPGTMFTGGGGSLGWSTGAAIGVKLARPDALVVALSGDGSYMFSVPSTAHWMARRYQTPFLQVVYNNGGWRAPRFSAMSVHKEGYASRGDDIDVSFDPPPDYSGIAAAAGGAYAEIVKHPEDVEPALERALRAIREEHRCAVIDAWLPR